MSTAVEGDSDMEELFGLSDFKDEGDDGELIQVSAVLRSRSLTSSLSFITVDR
jgi:hypothetical protein